MASHYQYSLERASRRNAVRAADADRERTAEQLRTSHVEGRLDLGEFQQRLDLCYAAKTVGDLAALVGDLPGRRERADIGSFAWLGRRRWVVATVAFAAVALISIAASAGHHAGWYHGGWFWIPLVFVFWRLSPWRRRRGRFGGPHSGGI